MKNADMPAMPSGAIVRSRTNRNDPGSDFFVVSETSATNIGMTKREHFAAMAMQGLLANPVSGNEKQYMNTRDWIEDMPAISLQLADALLAELERTS